LRTRSKLKPLAPLGALTFAGILALAGAAHAQAVPPLAQPAPLPPRTPAPRDIAFPGVIRLTVDATDIQRRIFQVHEQIPVTGGQPLTLLFPQWLPGDHEPSGTLSALAGLIVTADGQRVEWTRDTVNVWAFHLTPPAGAKTIDLNFQDVTPVNSAEGRVVVTPEMLNIEWNQVALYPAGYFVRDIPIEAQVILPPGWTQASALDVASQSGATTIFKAAPLDVLMDSPILAGAYFKRIDLDPGAATPVNLDLLADSPDLLEIKPDQLAAHRALIQQAYRLFGSHHYDHYDFLLSVTDQLGDVGLEHHRSSEDGVDRGYFTEWDKYAGDRDLLPHEFTHSWNGKFRRPYDLWTADYNTPMRDSLLWVYEGQTQYWGYVLSARSGLLTKDLTLGALASIAARYDHVPGQAWKALQDTTNDPIIAQRAPEPWTSWQRSEDYYDDGLLIWLDADTLIRQRSGGKRSLDDFAKAFFGVDNGAYTELTYNFDDVVAALNAVEPYDWASFLRTRLDSHPAGAPLDGLARGGYRLVYMDTPTEYEKQLDDQLKIEDMTYSLGFQVLTSGGGLRSVLWDGPAFKAGLTASSKIVAVNGVAFDPDRLKAVITAAKTGAAPIELLVRDGDHYHTVSIDYHGGLRYPHLEKIGPAPASLDAILAAKP
jgi:predicted metalloprotease with PDZ domain